MAENVKIPSEHRLRKVSGNMGRFFGLVNKNLKLSLRDKGNYFWVIGYPMLFIMIFALAFNTSGGQRSTYSVIFINEDVIGATTDLEQNVSLTFLNLFDDSDPNNELAQTFLRKTMYANGTLFTKDDALALVAKGDVDAVIIIPQNFSEVVIGSTWWYQMMKSAEFQMMPPEMQSGFQQGLPAVWVAAINNNSVVFPSNSSPALEIHSVPDTVTKAVIGGVFDGIMNDIVLSYNNVSRVETKVIESGVQFTLTPFDWMAPGIVIVGVTIAIMMIAQNFGLEKEKGLLRRLDTTPVPRSTQLLAGGFAQLIFSAVQIIILLSFLKIFGLQTAPTTNWGLAFLVALIMTIPCIGIGLIIAALVKSGSEAGGLSWIAILPLQFLGNAFFNLGDKGIMQAVPTFYGVKAMRDILVYGLGIVDILSDLLIIIGFGVVFLSIGLLVYHKKSQV
jgi:ABC-2 type transport system permease protein